MADKSERAQRDEAILSFWKNNKIFEKSLEKPAPKGEFVFYEGPPTANGRPAIHHLEARVFKDAIPRYKTMRGYRVPRKAGWDTHGLPVELEVEKQLGLKSKKEIEEYGIAKFNEECKKSVWKYVDEWKQFTERIGYWVDLENPYVTYENSYIQEVWKILAHVEKRGLLYKDYKVLPWCPRCGTALSSHELAQGYQDVKDLSLYVKFKVVGQENTYLIAWTTTPWTLPGNVALAVGKSIKYSYIKDTDGSLYVVASDLVPKLFGEKAEAIIVTKEVLGNDLIGLEYEQLYEFAPRNENSHKVYAADFVTTEDGTGIVHTAVMYGQDDFVLGNKVGLPKQHLVDDSGHFNSETGFLAGKSVVEESTAVEILKDLQNRKLLFDKESYTHSYPFCWRCKTKLIYYARDSWYIAMSKLRDELVKENKKINWEPEHIKNGRFGEWLREVKDWAISRERYWGTPLPIWQNADGSKRLVIDSVETLKKYSKLPLSPDLDLHRPHIDEIVLEVDGEEYRRVKEVMDVWFDSGAMPFAQNPEKVLYPADFISEAIDQTRGWFYTLHAIGVLMGKGQAYKNVICLGHILDKDGKKMSKSVGNVVNPWEMVDKYGVDTLRLWMYSVNQPGDSKNFDERSVDEIQKRIFNILNNVLSFYELYRDKSLESNNQPLPDNILDRWVIERLTYLIEENTTYLDDYKLLEPVRNIRSFIDDISTWYLRRSRERIKSGDVKAKQTLYFVLKNVSLLLAPFAPFASEDIYQQLKLDKDVESVHLQQWPRGGRRSYLSSLNIFHTGRNLIKDMEETRRITSLALEARSKAGIKVRQPLSRLEIKPKLGEEYLEIIKDELNVKTVVINPELADEVHLDTSLTPELIEEGELRDVVRTIQDWRKEQGLRPGDKANFPVPEEKKAFFHKHAEEIKRVTNVEF